TSLNPLSQLDVKAHVYNPKLCLEKKEKKISFLLYNIGYRRQDLMMWFRLAIDLLTSSPQML
ncbi:hypothetical protein ACQP3L_37675, partial [Escherichia coli]